MIFGIIVDVSVLEFELFFCLFAVLFDHFSLVVVHKLLLRERFL